MVAQTNVHLTWQKHHTETDHYAQGAIPVPDPDDGNPKTISKGREFLHFEPTPIQAYPTLNPCPDCEV